MVIKEVMIIFLLEKIRKKMSDQRGQSTLEYALVTVIAGVISAVLVAVGKPMIVDIIGKVFTKISSMV
jgi:Flp pilus assembly pilin Flp